MTDHEFAGESGTNSAADAAWLRISARVDRVLKRVESAAAALLERKLTDDERTDAAAAANQIAAWLGHLGLAAAAALSRQLAALWEPDEPKAGVTVQAAALIDELRMQLVYARADLAVMHDDAPAVAFIGSSSSAADSALLVAAAAGAHVLHSPDGMGDEMPGHPEAVAVYCSAVAGEVDTIMVRGIAERLHGTPILAVADAASTQDRRQLAQFADTVMDASSPPRDIVEELMRLSATSALNDRVALIGDGGIVDEAIVDVLGDRGIEALLVTGDDALIDLVRSKRVRGVVMTIASPESVAKTIRLLRSDVSARAAGVVVAMTQHDTDARVRLYRAGADDVVVGSIDADELAARVKAMLSTRAILNPLRVTGPRRTMAPWTSAKPLIDRLLTGSQRSGHASSLALIRTGSSDESAEELTEKYELLVKEFRDGDVVGRRSENEIVVALSGASRRTAVQRVSSVLTGLRLADSHRAGVVEFPYDGRNVETLLRASSEAIDRSLDADGPAVVATDWRPVAERAPDVVIVDPDETLAGVLSVALERDGIRTSHLLDGGEAVDFFLGPNRQLLPRVVLLEFDTPGVEGLQLLRRLREGGVLSRVRVLMLSTRMEESDLRRAFDLGAVDVIKKPFPAALLMQRLRRTLNQ